MEILEKPNDRIKGFASLANIGYDLFEVNLEGEVYKYGIRDKAERVGSNKWKIHKCDDSFNLIERVMRADVLVGCAWYNVDEKVWENSTYADTIRRCKEFFNTSAGDIAKTIYQTNNGFSYYVTRYGEVWNTERMIKLKGGVGSGDGYRHVKLGYVHRLVAHHFVRVSEDLLAQGLTEETLVVNHLDGNGLNNRWDNLEWTTHITIVDHLLERIWQYLQAGYSDTTISKETGVRACTVSRIRQGTSPRYRTDKYTWSTHSLKPHKPYKLDKDTIFNIYDEFVYTDKSNSELSRKYNVSDKYIYYLRTGRRYSNLAREYVNSKGLDRYWRGYNPPK